MPSNQQIVTTDDRLYGEAGLKGANVLVVNDHWDHAESMARLLRLYGHDVRTAVGGPSALKAAAARPPDVVLLDIMMPGMDGFEVARRLRRMLSSRCLIVALTAFGSPEDRQKSFDAGFDLHLVKPANPLQIERILRELAQSLVGDHPAAKVDHGD